MPFKPFHSLPTAPSPTTTHLMACILRPTSHSDRKKHFSLTSENVALISYHSLSLSVQRTSSTVAELKKMLLIKVAEKKKIHYYGGSQEREKGGRNARRGRTPHRGRGGERVRRCRRRSQVQAQQEVEGQTHESQGRKVGQQRHTGGESRIKQGRHINTLIIYPFFDRKIPIAKS